MSRVLLICVANVCRSPVAEALFKHHLPELTVSSAGLLAIEGLPAHAHMIQLLKARGIDLSGHASRPLAHWMLRHNDLILVMAHQQRHDLAQRNPTLRGKIFLLGQFLNQEITDPIDQPLAAFDSCISTIERCVLSWAKPLQSLGRRPSNPSPCHERP